MLKNKKTYQTQGEYSCFKINHLHIGQGYRHQNSPHQELCIFVLEHPEIPPLFSPKKTLYYHHHLGIEKPKMCWLKPGGIWWDTHRLTTSHPQTHGFSSHLGFHLGFFNENGHQLLHLRTVTWCERIYGDEYKILIWLYLSYLVFGVDNFWQFYWEGWNSSFMEMGRVFLPIMANGSPKGLLIKWQTFGSAFPWWVRPWWFISVLTNQRLHTRQNTKQKHRRFVFHSYHQLSRAKVVGLVTKSLLRKVVENKTNVSQHLKRYHTICHFSWPLVPLKKTHGKELFLDIEKMFPSDRSLSSRILL